MLEKNYPQKIKHKKKGLKQRVIKDFSNPYSCIRLMFAKLYNYNTYNKNGSIE